MFFRELIVSYRVFFVLDKKPRLLFMGHFPGSTIRAVFVGFQKQKGEKHENQ